MKPSNADLLLQHVHLHDDVLDVRGSILSPKDNLFIVLISFIKPVKPVHFKSR